MVKLKEILEKLSPELRYGEPVMNMELGNVDFDTFTDANDKWVHEFSNSTNPDIKLRIKDDFPFRAVLMEKKGNILHGTRWNGQKSITWTENNPKYIKEIWK